MTIFFLVTLIVIFWLALAFFNTEAGVETQHPKHIKRALIIFPHPDDEALSCGGTIKLLQRQGAEVTLAVLTLGERGTKDGSASKKLAKVRSAEMRKSAKILGVDKLILEDFGDGILATKESLLQKYVQKLLEDINPDLIITYDLSGLYGHEDHIALSEIVTKLHVRFWAKKSRLWYVSLPNRLLKFIKLPEHMAKDPLFRTRRMAPTHKVFILPFMLYKLRAFWAHQSQHEGFRSGLPLRSIIPAEFFYSTRIFEYFYEVTVPPIAR